MTKNTNKQINKVILGLFILSLVLIPGGISAQEVDNSSPSLLERVKESRNSLIRDRIYEDRDETTSRANLENRIQKIENQVVALEIKQAIYRTNERVSDLDTILNLLEINIQNSSSTVASSTSPLLEEARVKINTASTTLNNVTASTTLIELDDVPIDLIQQLKTRILDSINNLKSAKEDLEEVVSILKS